MSIEALNISKRFGDFHALKNVTLQVPSGELVALLGPSGSGKTTLLRIIAGLEIPDEGSILFHGEDTTNRNLKERNVGFVFQHYALFRHMTVFDNVAFGLKVRPRETRPSKEAIQKKVMDLLSLVQLHTQANRYPSELSGGQRQRVALARALAVEPKVLLLDEPFGALDAKVRKELRRWLRRLHDEIHITSVFVTHDQEEALEVADRVAVMNEGQIEQEGTPDEVYHHPRSPFILNFMGSINLFHGRNEDGKAFIGNTQIEVPPTAFQDHKNAMVFIRPHLLDIHQTPTEDGYIAARIAHINSAGPLVRVELITEDGDPVEVELSHARYRMLKVKEQDAVYVTPKEVSLIEDYSI